MQTLLTPRTAAIAACLAIAAATQAQITITGVTDQNWNYNNSASFTVVTEAGYDYGAFLNGKPVAVGEPVGVGVDYYELMVYRTNQTSSAVESRRLQFIVRSSERGGSESGLPAWVPYPMIPSSLAEFGGARLRLLVPSAFPEGYRIPVVAWVVNEQNHAVRVNGRLEAANHPSIDLKRGVGSGFLDSTHPAGALVYEPAVRQLGTNKTVMIESGTVWTTVSGILGGSTAWADDARVYVNGHLTIPAGETLTIGAGAAVRLGPGVNVTNNGTLLISGTVERPVVFMPNSAAQPWGGFVMREGTGAITGTGVIFTGSGAVPNWFGNNGNPGSHRLEQALFYVNDDQSVSLTDSAAIFLAGQLGHARGGGSFTFNRFLLQRCTTGGQYAEADFIVNDSAFIECPDDTVNFEDGDNDGLYLESGTCGFTNTLIGWTKDDGVDSGGSDPGVFNYRNCWFEANFHEGNSLSGTGKDVRHYDGVFINNGQGLEDGYDGPEGTADHCLFTGNLVGARFGDNYNWTYTGFLTVIDSISIYNYRDVWGMNWADWTYRVGQMDIRNNLLTASNPNHVDNAVWNPAGDGALLAPFLTTPAGVMVGVGLAIRDNLFGVEEINNRLPVGLSSFSTLPVSVEYSVEGAGGTVASGTVNFAPGETIRHIELSIASPEDYGALGLILRDPVNGELTGTKTAMFAQGVGGPGPGTTILIAAGSTWRYRDDASAAPAGWQLLDFADDTWGTGATELGFGDNDEAHQIADNNQITSYFRKKFNVANPGVFDDLTMWLLRDDGAVVYLNGVEVYRTSNLPAAPAPIAYSQLAGNDGDNVVDNAMLSAAALVAGENIASVEVHQQSATSSDVSFNFSLTGNQPPPPPTLELLRLGEEVWFVWRDETYSLEWSEEVKGAVWNPVAGASPVALTIDGNRRFFRLRKP